MPEAWHTTSTLPMTLRALDAGFERGQHIGAQLYISRNSQPLAEMAIGEREPGEAMQPDTLVCWLSASKPITAIAVAQLFETGALNLDDPVAKHVPEFAAEGKEAITLRHVLTHTGGFRKVRIRFPDDDWQQIIEKICQARPESNWPAGQKAGYHPHTGWYILGEVVQRVADQALPQYLRDAIFEPLGMDDTWLGMTEQAYQTYSATGRLGVLIDTSADEPKPHDYHEPAQVIMPRPGSNAFGPMRELGRLYEMLLRGGQLDGPRVLEPETIELFTARQRVGLFDYTFKHTIDWSLGFICDSKQYADENTGKVPYGYGPHASSRTFGHSGWQSCAAFCDPEHQLVVAVHLNGTPGERPHDTRIHQLLGAMYEDLGLA